jgi:hypothetical protein
LLGDREDMGLVMKMQWVSLMEIAGGPRQHSHSWFRILMDSSPYLQSHDLGSVSQPPEPGDKYTRSSSYKKRIYRAAVSQSFDNHWSTG